MSDPSFEERFSPKNRFVVRRVIEGKNPAYCEAIGKAIAKRKRNAITDAHLQNCEDCRKKWGT